MKYLKTQIHNAVNGEAVIVAELNGQIKFCNTEALLLYQYPSLQVMKQHSLIDLMPEDFAPYFPEEIRPEHLSAVTYMPNVNRRKNGELFACKLRTNYQTVDGTKFLITHIKPMYKQVDMEKICLRQKIEVLKCELEAERKKNTSQAFQQSSRQLSQCYPSLSTNDLKVCHYLIRNFNSKRISKELNITVDGVFAARKRIRKKLELDPSEDLVKALLHSQSAY